LVPCFSQGFTPSEPCQFIVGFTPDRVSNPVRGKELFTYPDSRCSVRKETYSFVNVIARTDDLFYPFLLPIFRRYAAFPLFLRSSVSMPFALCPMPSAIHTSAPPPGFSLRLSSFANSRSTGQFPEPASQPERKSTNSERFCMRNVPSIYPWRSKQLA
jgi:hypothetical protein